MREAAIIANPMISEIVPGITKPTAPIISVMRRNMGTGPLCQPITAIAAPQTPIKALKLVDNISKIDPCMRSPEEEQNANGTRKEISEYRNAVNPVRNGSSCTSPAEVKAARATGGVMLPIQEK